MEGRGIVGMGFVFFRNFVLGVLYILVFVNLLGSLGERLRAFVLLTSF